MTTLLKQVCWKLNLHHNWIRPVTRLIRFITFFWARFSVILSKTKLISLLFLLSFDDEKPTDGERLDHFRNNMHLMSKSGIIRSIVFSRSMIFPLTAHTQRVKKVRKSVVQCHVWIRFRLLSCAVVGFSVWRFVFQWWWKKWKRIKVTKWCERRRTHLFAFQMCRTPTMRLSSKPNHFRFYRVFCLFHPIEWWAKNTTLTTLLLHCNFSWKQSSTAECFCYVFQNPIMIYEW